MKWPWQREPVNVQYPEFSVTSVSEPAWAGAMRAFTHSLEGDVSEGRLAALQAGEMEYRVWQFAKPCAADQSSQGPSAWTRRRFVGGDGEWCDCIELLQGSTGMRPVLTRAEVDELAVTNVRS